VRKGTVRLIGRNFKKSGPDGGETEESGCCKAFEKPTSKTDLRRESPARACNPKERESGEGKRKREKRSLTKF